MDARPLDILTNSRLSTLRRCPKKHWYRYELCLSRQRTADALRFGAAFHRGLELHNNGLPPEQAIGEAIAGYDVVPEWSNAFDWEEERESVTQLLGELPAGVRPARRGSGARPRQDENEDMKHNCTIEDFEQQTGHLGAEALAGGRPRARRRRRCRVGLCSIDDPFCCQFEVEPDFLHPRLLDAYRISRSARFERGETPRTA